MAATHMNHWSSEPPLVTASFQCSRDLAHGSPLVLAKAVHRVSWMTMRGFRPPIDSLHAVLVHLRDVRARFSHLRDCSPGRLHIFRGGGTSNIRLLDVEAPIDFVDCSLTLFNTHECTVVEMDLS
ncbi:hypothetical protein PIIN_07980 [Serendipita indica DSM 11827]|uniref:Uncharacterized protein n=1 Tax=Serendipita indica (strain DSM 11827) TaxID=1109443 RepID=G4TRT3_SERID|nr:hypothetical protein PIIN_07980 [Serendipita indica DSM 11827]